MEPKLEAASRKIYGHLKALNDSGRDMQKYLTALRAIRDDPTLSKEDRDLIHKAIAQNAMMGYRACVTGFEVDPLKMIAECAKKVGIDPNSL